MQDIRYRLLIFDLDGTLIDSQKDLADAVNFTRASYGLPAIDEEAVRSFVGSGVRVLMERAIEGLSQKEIDNAVSRFKEYYSRHLLDSTTLYPGVTDVLERLGMYAKVVLTNKPEEFSKKILKHLGILHHFALVWGGDTGPRRKPDPEPIIEIMKRLDIGLPQTLMIGDGINDILAAKAAGIRCAALGNGYTNSQDLAALKPDYLFLRVEELLGILPKSV